MKTKILFALLVIGQTIFSQNETSRKIGDFKILKVYDLVNIELVRAEEKTGKVKEVFDSVATNYDLMNDLMSMEIGRASCRERV